MIEDMGLDVMKFILTGSQNTGGGLRETETKVEKYRMGK